MSRLASVDPKIEAVRGKLPRARGLGRGAWAQGRGPVPGAQGPWPGLARGLGPGVSKCVAAFAVPRSTVCGKGWGGDALIRAPLRVADVGGGLGDVGGEGEVGGMG